MKTNVTLKLDADLLREARVLAADEGRSISALLTDRLEALICERKAFDKAHHVADARNSLKFIEIRFAWFTSTCDPGPVPSIMTTISSPATTPPQSRGC